MKKNAVILYNNLGEEKDQNIDIYKDIRLIAEAIEERGDSVTKIMVDNNIRGVVAHLLDNRPEYIFNLCEEVENNSWGEIYVAGIIELLKIPYTGSGPFCLALSLNKAKSKDILKCNEIPVPDYQVFNSENEELKLELKFPLIVKPLYEDGSFGIEKSSVVNNTEELKNQVKKKREEFNELVIVEQYIEGREINVAVLGNKDYIEIMPISEIDYSTMPDFIPKICTYSAKWEKESIEYKASVPVCPAKLTEEQKEILKDTAIRVYKLMDCKDYARVDIRLSKENIPYVIDINPNPCISPDSGIIRSARVSGLEYNDFIDKIITNCQKRYNGSKSIHETITT